MAGAAKTATLNSPVRLLGVVQNYAWGKPSDASLVSKYAGLCDPSKPFAELWYGTHPKGPTTCIFNGGRRLLREVIAESPEEVLGSAAVMRFGNELPFLFKVLSINEALSIQSHPSKSSNPWSEQPDMPLAFKDNHAAYLHWKDPLNYPDDNHKPELAVALSTLSLLHGFKPVDSLLETLRNTPELVALIGEKRAQMLTIAPDTNSQAVAVKEIYRAVVESTPEQREKNMASFHSRLSAGETNLTWERPHLEKMFATYGSSDVGIPTSLLMNWTQVAPGKAVYMGPNDLHAYLEGDLIECMAASDNVVRAGLTRKFQDRAELLAMVKVLPAPTTIITPKPVRGSSIAARYPSEAAEFQVTAVSGESSLPEDFNTPTVTFVMCTSGVLTVETSGEAMSLPEGQLAMIPACANHFSLGCKGTGFIISVPDLPPQLAPALIRAS